MWILSLLACSDVSLLKTEQDECEAQVWYADADSDGVGGDEALAACEAPDGYVAETGDCDDQDASISPWAPEACNGIDDDCDGAIDQGLGSLESWYIDADGDGFGGELVEACEPPSGAVDIGGDCDDADPSVSPAGLEICNDVDDDCDGEVDNNASDTQRWYADADADGYGAESPTREACEAPEGFVDNDDDCDDTNATLNVDCGGTDDPPVVGTTCSGTMYRYSAATGEPELIVLSLYEADGGHGGPPGTVTVDIQRPTEMVLVVSSYEPVDWQISTVAGTTLNEVLANGYHSQTVSAPAGVPVSVRSYDQTRSNFGASCGYSWPYAGGGCDTNQLISGVQAYTGLSTTEFAGCYHGTSFLVE